jgi:hypothetical protein
LTYLLFDTLLSNALKGYSAIARISEGNQ